MDFESIVIKLAHNMVKSNTDGKLLKTTRNLSSTDHMKSNYILNNRCILLEVVYDIHNIVSLYLPQCTKRMHNAKFWRNHFQSLLIVVLLATQRLPVLLLFGILPMLHFVIFVDFINLCLLTDGALKVYCYIFIVQNWVIKWFFMSVQ